ncbi:MAG TPA: ketopantoate reductase family protein [Steroidobacteraceae bacterium]|nr:ketopantoate reductase family protein [Steroidobacteraceae bacterium]
MNPGAPEFEFVVLGAGAIGSILAAHLARAGHSVAMLARGRRAEQVRADGLHITGLAEFSTPVRVFADPRELRSAGVLIVAMKTPGTAEALARIRHAAVETTFSIQNGPLKNELLAEAFGESRVLGALADTSGELLPSGEVQFTRNVNLFVGELAGGLSERAERIAKAIDAAGVRAAAVADIRSLEWSKFAAWVGLMPLSVTTRAPTWRYLTDPDAALVLARLVREMGRLVRAMNITLTDQSVLPVATVCASTEPDAAATIIRVGREFEAKAPTHRMSSLQDFEAGRPLEIHETLGYALRKAAQYAVALPLVETFYHIVAAVDRMRS